MQYGFYNDFSLFLSIFQAKYVSSSEGALSKNLFLKVLFHYVVITSIPCTINLSECFWFFFIFFQDKKNRYYIVSAMVDTKVDMKGNTYSFRRSHYILFFPLFLMLMGVTCDIIKTVLSQRLGLGKGGIRMAPEEALAELLQVSHY